MKLIKNTLFMALIICTVPLFAEETVGWVEKAALTSQGIEIRAKIDSGAKHSSLHCGCIKKYEKEGKSWVDLKIKNFKGEQVIISRQIVRSAKIKRHDDKFQTRDVIKLKICLGSVLKEVEVNLIDRTGLNYQLLVGRSFLAGDFLIDSDKTYINPPKCS